MAKVTVLTYDGEEWCAKRLAGTGNAGQWVAWGTGGTTAVKADETLTTEKAAKDDISGRVNGTDTYEAGAYPQDSVFQVVATLTADDYVADNEINEAGLFDANTAGTMIISGTFDAIPVSEDDQITFTFTINPS